MVLMMRNSFVCISYLHFPEACGSLFILLPLDLGLLFSAYPLFFSLICFLLHVLLFGSFYCLLYNFSVVTLGIITCVVFPERVFYHPNQNIMELQSYVVLFLLFMPWLCLYSSITLSDKFIIFPIVVFLKALNTFPSFVLVPAPLGFGLHGFWYSIIWIVLHLFITCYFPLTAFMIFLSVSFLAI